ncbi:hypothetical protein C8Q80DRAFT_455554 [Daedaleopsis nitida]|nr:hypothetical protein C8Q80DRAFT_455554 [Daedaleopsis nitida]
MRIPEDVLLSRQPDDSFVLTSKKISLLISSWLFGSATPAVESTLTLEQLDHSSEMVDWALAAVNEAVVDYRHGRGFFRNMDPALTSHEMNDIACSLNTFFSWLPSIVKRLRASFTLDMAKSRAEQRAAIRNILRAESETPPIPLLYGMLHGATWEAYERRLVAAGWCPYTANLLSFDPQAIGFVSIADPFFRNSSEGVWEHAQCTRTACVAYNRDPDDYKTQHAPSCSDPSCSFLCPSLARISELLSVGEIPVIVYSDGALTVRGAADGPFIAISHVWADGLGSIAEDGLPICQITRIAQYARDFVPDGAFWIDSLCVPGVKEMRKQAIHLMADTYRRAEKVIVFDAGIRASPTAPLREVLLRITTSSWMQRVWTLQEAFLARDIYFELSDRLLPIQHLVDVYDSAAEPVDCALGTTVPRDFALFSCLTETLMLMFERTTRTFTFRDIVTLLDNRATSKPEDETVAIAGLLGVDVAKLLAEPDADGRMRAFLLEVRTLPASIIVHAGRAGRLPQPGFRWAPRALTALSVVVSGEQFGTAECTPEGLTTDRKFSLIVLPEPVTLKRMDAAKDVLGPISVVNPSSGATYVIMGHDSMLGDESVPFNALVTVPGFLELLKHTPSMLPIVAVWLATPHAGMSWSREPVECQYLFNAGLSDMTSFMPTHGISPLDDDAPTVVQGRFDSVRIKIT